MVYRGQSKLYQEIDMGYYNIYDDDTFMISIQARNANEAKELASLHYPDIGYLSVVPEHEDENEYEH